MNKNHLYIFTFFILSSCSTSTEIFNSNSTFRISIPEINDVPKMETRLNGKEIFRPYSIGLSDEYFPGIKNFDFSQPKIYSRKNGLLKTKVSYFFTKNDNKIRLIEYSWDNLKDSDSIKNIYAENESMLNNYFKKKGKLRLDDDPTYWQEELFWENDRIFVFQFILGDKSKKAYRTRLIVRQK